MEQLPVSLNLKGKKVVVTGGGTVAARKTELALRAGADVVVVTPKLGPEFDVISGHRKFHHRAGSAEAQDFDSAIIAYAASEDHAEDERVQSLAKQQHVLVNVPDRMDLCDFSMPTILDRSPLLISIATAGKSPLLARQLKQRMESMIPAAYGDLAGFLGSIREHVAARIEDPRERRYFFERLLDSSIADLVLAGNETRARAELEDQLNEHRVTTIGEVYLVGGGPGDPDLLTFRAMRLLQRADVVVYDRLVGSPILDLVRRDAERIYVGKRMNHHELSQPEISRLLVKLAREGKRVLRLKGGDPFIFGRGGEEIEMLASEGIPFQVVPGITAAAGCASYAGIPLTHRDHAQSCIFVTGHSKSGRVELDWNTLLQPHQTVAVYMGLAMLPDLARDFLAHGADPEMPVAVIDNGTRANQAVVTGTITDIAEKVAEAAFKGPAMIIIGTVVQLHDKLRWFKPGSTQAASDSEAAKSTKPVTTAELL